MQAVIDFSNMFKIHYHSQYRDVMKSGFGLDVLENGVRNSIYDKIMSLIKDYNLDNNIVYALDCGSWRKDFFPFYKFKRAEEAAKEPKEGDVNIVEMNRFMDELIKEIKEYFPGKVIKIPKCEGDDIVGTIALNHKQGDENLIIFSRDHDFLQCISEGVFLHDFKKIVDEYCIYEFTVKGEKNKFMLPVTPDNKNKFLVVQILQGDSGDGIPNVISDDDSFANPVKKQATFGIQKIVKTYFSEGMESINAEQLKLIHNNYTENFKRNQKLVDLSCTPKDLKTKILAEYKDKNSYNTLSYELIKEWAEQNNLLSILSGI